MKPKFGKPADESHKEKHLLSAGSNKPKKGETNSGNEIGQGPKKVSTNTYGPTSSLFRKNPEVPQVENKSIKPKNEAVFSSKFFKDVAELHPHTVSLWFFPPSFFYKGSHFIALHLSKNLPLVVTI